MPGTDRGTTAVLTESSLDGALLANRERVGVLAAELASGLLASRPDLRPYPAAVAAWARAEARGRVLAELRGEPSGREQPVRDDLVAHGEPTDEQRGERVPDPNRDRSLYDLITEIVRELRARRAR